MGLGCVYGIYVGSRLIYIGRTKNLQQRVSGHLTNAYKQSRSCGSNLYTILHMCITKGVAPKFKILSKNPLEECKYILRYKHTLVSNQIMGERVKKLIPPCRTVKISEKDRRGITNDIMKGIKMQQLFVYGTDLVEKAKANNTLIQTERTELRNATIGHGKLKAFSDNMGVSRQTVYNAIHGAGISPDNLNAIRTYLQAKKQVA